MTSKNGHQTECRLMPEDKPIRVKTELKSAENYLDVRNYSVV